MARTLISILTLGPFSYCVCRGGVDGYSGIALYGHPFSDTLVIRNAIFRGPLLSTHTPFLFIFIFNFFLSLSHYHQCHVTIKSTSNLSCIQHPSSSGLFWSHASTDTVAQYRCSIPLHTYNPQSATRSSAPTWVGAVLRVTDRKRLEQCSDFA
jgi:hypothetical protein